MNLFPKQNIPYFIVSPSYTHKSSGVRTLHLLCHALNESGQIAYIIPDNPNGYATNPSLNTPMLFPQYQNFYQSQDYIAIYPDIVKGNPLEARYVVRYLLAPAGAYGGDSDFIATDQIWGALPSLAKNVLRIPVSDIEIFYDTYELRSGSCFYSHKYEMHGNQLLDITKDSVRLEGSLEHISATLKTAEVCYLYEVSSILTEAALCGCRVELVKTDYFNSIDPACMMGEVKWNNGEIVKTCDDYLPEYQKFIDYFPDSLKDFIKKTQGML